MRCLTVNNGHWWCAKWGQAYHAALVDSQVIGDYRGRGIQVQVGEPTVLPDPAHVAVGRQAVIKVGIHLFLECELESWCAGYCGAYRRLSNECANIAGIDRLIGQQVKVSLDLLIVYRQHL